MACGLQDKPYSQWSADSHPGCAKSRIFAGDSTGSFALAVARPNQQNEQGLFLCLIIQPDIMAAYNNLYMCFEV